VNPLAPKTYLVRNASRTIPLVLVIVLSVALIAGIITLMNSIPLSIRTIYAYSKFYAGITPRGDPELTPKIREQILADSPVPIDRIITCRTTDTVVRSIVGKWPFVVLALEPADMQYYLQRLGGPKIEGRLPAEGVPEALVSEPMARNLGLKLGDDLLSPEKTEGYSPMHVKIVGIAQTQYWAAFIPIGYHAQHHFPPVDVLAVYARGPTEQKELDSWLLKTFKGDRARIFVYSELEKDTDEMFKILYRILNLVIGTLVAVITLVMALLMNIYQAQRVQEFGLLQALGYSKRAVLRRVFLENLLVVIGGWVLGVIVVHLALRLAYQVLMYPQAFALDVWDPGAYAYTAAVPVAILVAGAWTIYHRFKDFDPVGVVERRVA